MKRFILIIWLFAVLSNSELLSQSKEEIRNNFKDAESLIIYEAYDDAIPIYLQLLRTNPSNSNYKYRIGQCYLNTPGEKTKAISFLEDAVININPDYKEGKFTETGAPIDALYYLANAYLINNQIDKALKAYEQFKQKLNPAVYDSIIVNLNIQSCRNAKELIKMPLDVRLVNLGSTINSSGNDFNPVISEKEDIIVFSRSMAFYDAILYSTKINGKWSEPVNLNELMKIDRDLFPTSLSKDGKTLYLYNSADYDGTIYTSHFENGNWSSMVKLNDNINTKYWESHATLSHDNKKLYFTSNRKGTLGGLDLYVSNRDSSGDWGPAVNLGSKINTHYNEESPFLGEDDMTLFFSSRGHFNMGGYDVFYSKQLENGEWSTPENIGYPLNSTDDDVFFKPLHMGHEGYTSKEIPGGMGDLDIYHIEILPDTNMKPLEKQSVIDLIPEVILATDSAKPADTAISITATEIIVQGDTTEYNLANQSVKIHTERGETQVKQAPAENDNSALITAIKETETGDDKNESVKSTFHKTFLLVSMLLGSGILFLLFILWRRKQSKKN